MKLRYAQACCRFHCLCTTEPTLLWQLAHAIFHPFGL